MNKKLIYRLIGFWVLNFAALALGSIFTRSGVASDWYANLSKAPWEPPGWVFGAAWTAIMICFGIYMAYLWPLVENRNMLVRIYAAQLLLNISWNPIFFYYHHVLGGLVLITLLTIIVAIFLFKYRVLLKTKSLLILPYLIWLLIATSLNAYILFNN